MSSEETRGERLQLMLTTDELKALDDFRSSRRMPSRAAAVRELMKRADWLLKDLLTPDREQNRAITV